MPEIERSWHGFRDYVDFARASLVLGLTISGLLWAVLTYALDGRYAASTISKTVAENHKVATDVARQVRDLQITMLRGQMFELRVKQCDATTASARRFFARRIQELTDQYAALGNSPTNLPSCAELQ